MNARPATACGVLVLTVAGLLAGCGRKAPPRPSEAVRPQRIADLSAANTPSGIALSWSRPRTYADGTRMDDLGSFEVQRAIGSDPAAPFERLTTLEVTDRERFRQTRTFHYIDAAVSTGTAYRYRVVSSTTDRYRSAPSNIATAERTSPNEDSHASLSATPR